MTQKTDRIFAKAMARATAFLFLLENDDFPPDFLAGSAVDDRAAAGGMEN